MNCYGCRKCELIWFSSKKSSVCPYCEQSNWLMLLEDIPDNLPKLSRYNCTGCNSKMDYVAGMSVQCCGSCSQVYEDPDLDMEVVTTVTTSSPFKPFKAPSKSITPKKTVVIQSPKVTLSREERIEKQTIFHIYQCKGFDCLNLWASDTRHKSSRCPFCGKGLFELVKADEKNVGAIGLACLICGCMICYSIEQSAPQHCPYCGENNLSRQSNEIRKALLASVRARKAKYLVDESLQSTCRINFRQDFKNSMPSIKDISGVWMHRRHVIPQHLLRAVWNAAVKQNNAGGKHLEVLASALGLNGKFKNEQHLASAILYTLNENAKNLFLAEGTPNSAIGALAHSLHELAAKYSNLTVSSSNPLSGLIEEFKSIKSPPQWGKAVGQLVHEIIQTYTEVLEEASSLQEAVSIVEDLADTANLDLDTTAQGLGNQNKNAVTLYLKFQQWEQSPGSWDDFIQLLLAFMSTDMVG
ncbi:hypothetical protein HUA74_19830 [Myxococcus sp. CA051A]|uniref:hypothetical protein n=1 Tax=Myxococcus sp. CA051A TaxID=2741739 RepID=UPI00157AF485|nr:hypothetical protein [Myxococcus sp. CA051A]NTX62902.1 hypothetical protein [Myxococcus sp. CA051A]